MADVHILAIDGFRPRPTPHGSTVPHPHHPRRRDARGICITNNAAERALRCVPLGREAWLFYGSDRGGERAAVIYTLIQTANLNDVDPQGWLADVLARVAKQPVSRLGELLPWNWRTSGLIAAAA